ncbi:MAG: hypothetical protein PVG14_05735 [Anaerolineales bacterium]
MKEDVFRFPVWKLILKYRICAVVDGELMVYPLFCHCPHELERGGLDA